MPQIAQRLREPAALALLAYAAVATLLHTIDFLFAPGQSCVGPFCASAAPPFSSRALSALGELANPFMALVLVAAVYLAHVGTRIKQAKIVTLVALATAAIALLFGVVALFASFGADGVGGWGKTENFLIGATELAILGIAAWLIFGYWQQHAPVKPAAGLGAPGPQAQFQQQGQWQAPGQPQAPQQGQWQPQPPQPPQQAPQWGQQPPQQPAQGQPWGAPPPPPQQQGFAPHSDSMMTQAIPSSQQPQPGHPQQGQPAPETQQFPPVGNWTSE